MKILFKSKKETLNSGMEKFCQTYTQIGAPHYGIAWKSYAIAYDHDWESLSNEKDNGKTSPQERKILSMQVLASRLMREDRILDRIREILSGKLDDDSIFDARLTEIASKGDDREALNAIKQRNELKGRIIKKIDIKTDNPLASMSDEELRKLAEREANR